jgi:hypothetical protein
LLDALRPLSRRAAVVLASTCAVYGILERHLAGIVLGAGLNAKLLSRIVDDDDDDDDDEAELGYRLR